MDDYSFWADVLTTFRSSSDLVKIIWLLIWLLAPILMVTGIIFAIAKLRRPIVQNLARPVFTFDTPDFGRVEVYHTETGRADAGALMGTLIKLNEFAPLLTTPKKPANEEYEDETL